MCFQNYLKMQRDFCICIHSPAGKASLSPVCREGQWFPSHHVTDKQERQNWNHIFWILIHCFSFCLRTSPRKKQRTPDTWLSTAKAYRLIHRHCSEADCSSFPQQTSIDPSNVSELQYHGKIHTASDGTRNPPSKLLTVRWEGPGRMQVLGEQGTGGSHPTRDPRECSLGKGYCDRYTKRVARGSWWRRRYKYKSPKGGKILENLRS